MGQVTTRHAGAHVAHSHVLHWLVSLGGIGLFGVSVVDSSVIPLPLPGSTDLILLVLVAHRANAWLMAAAAIAGSIVGGYITWSAGVKGGEAAIKRYVPHRFKKRISRWVGEYGMVTVAASSLLPPPVPLLPVLLAAGALGVSGRKFLFSYIPARTVRYGFVAWLGVTYGRSVLRAWNRYLAHWSTAIAWTIGLIMAAAIGYGVWKYRRLQRDSTAPAAGSLAGPSKA
jgi:membrane protein YqaA with SNARE-associated domain